MAWNFANWYVPLIEGCCHGTNVPVPYEDGMTFLESNESIITIVNQLIDNNNEIPDIIKEEVKTELAAYLDSDEGKQKIEDIVSTLDLPYVSKTGDTMTGKLTMDVSSPVEFLDNDNTRALLTAKKTTGVMQTRLLLGLSSNGKLNIYQLAEPQTSFEAANKKYVDDKVNALGNVLVFKGVKATIALLPSTGNNVGDVWYVEATKSAWAWVTDTTDPGGRWDEFGPVINLEPYFKKADIVQTTGTATDKVMSQKANTDNFVNKAGDTMTGKLIIDTDLFPTPSKVGLSVNGVLVVNSGSESINPKGDVLQLADTTTTPYPDRVLHHMLKLYNSYNPDDRYPLHTIGTCKESFTLRVPNVPNPTNKPVIWFTVWNEPSMDLISLKTQNLNQISYSPRIRLPGNIRIAELADPVDAQDAATKAYVDAHSGGSYTLPLATYDNLGGMKQSFQGTLTDTTNALKTSFDNNDRLYAMLTPAQSNKLGGIIADTSSEAMPVEIAIDPITHKLKGALMTAYQSPTTIGGVVSNGEKMLSDTIPVHMDSDGKQWVTPIGTIGKMNISAGEDSVLISQNNGECIIATLLGDEGTDDIWIKTTTLTNLGFNVKLNRAVPAGKTLTVCYLLFITQR